MKKLLALFLAVIIVIMVGAYLLLFKPYIEYSFERIDTQPVTFKVEYLNAVGDPLCTKLYAKLNKETYRSVIPRFPDDLQDPHENEELQFGEMVELTGYRYQSITNNKITGSKLIGKLDRVDVISWESVSAGFHSTKSTDIKPSDFYGANYTACLWGGE